MIMKRLSTIGLVLILAVGLGACAEEAMKGFGTPMESPHWMNNTPAHGSTLSSVPANVFLDFDFDLGPGGNITMMMGGRDYGLGETMISADNRMMWRQMDPSAPDGTYNVTYSACWPDGTCDDGFFEFAVGRMSAAAATAATASAKSEDEDRIMC
jgi:methionine-rich copper-binding protein CopC